MKIRELQDELLRLKRERDVCILAHSYQAQEILEIADFTGDSYQLSVQAAKVPQKTVVMCGVRFMAETVKILSPDKTVYLANSNAGCPMADQMDRQLVSQMKDMYPGYALACYINTTAELKTICDVCVTSSSAVKIIRALDARNILFVPDCNLGAYIAKQVPEKHIELVHGGCPTHLRISVRDVERARREHPNALLLVHPECLPEVCDRADFVGSTSAITNYALTGPAKEYLIGTENSIAEHLQYACPDRKFYPVTNDIVCHNMKITTLPDVYDCVAGNGGGEITLDAETISGARRCIDEMIRLGG
jgi:quinolinate synthase